MNTQTKESNEVVIKDKKSIPLFIMTDAGGGIGNNNGDFMSALSGTNSGGKDEMTLENIGGGSWTEDESTKGSSSSDKLPDDSWGESEDSEKKDKKTTKKTKEKSAKGLENNPAIELVKDVEFANEEDDTNKKVSKDNTKQATATATEDEETEDVVGAAEMFHTDLGFEFSKDEFVTNYGNKPDAISKWIRDVTEHTFETRLSKHEEVAKLYDYLEKGGDPNKYLTARDAKVNYASLDLKKENDRKIAITDHYKKTTSWSEDKIAKMVQIHFDMNEDETEAELAKTALVEIEDKATQTALQEQAEKEAADIRRAQADYKRNVDFIRAAEKIGGLPINEINRKKLEDYLYTPIGRDKAGNNITAYAEALSKYQDPMELQTKFAYLEMIGFDVNKLVEIANSNATRQVKNRLKSFKVAKSGTDTTKNGASERKETFSDYLG